MAADAAASSGAATGAADIVSTMHSPDHDMVLILDFGSQYSHIIVRRVRELGVYCELHSCLSPPSILSKGRIRGLILSGGPFSVYEDGAPHLADGFLEAAEAAKIPILGVCYGFQELVHRMGGKVEAAPKREFGHADLQIKHAVAEGAGHASLFEGLGETSPVWMSHGDKIVALPEGFVTTGITTSSEHASMEHSARRIFGLQFHPEVQHTPGGVTMLSNFVKNICGCSCDWSMKGFVDEAVATIRATVGETGRVIGAVSGGVDSTVAAVLMNRAIGDRFHAVLVDNGLLRKDEAVNVVKRLRDECGVSLTCVDASEEFLGRLAGVSDPEKKRKAIGNLFIEVFEREAARIGKCDFLLQGTLYPDVIESVSFRGPSATIKSHHNVGGLLDVMKLRLIEPLRELFKDEEACDLLREADFIYLEELRRTGEYDKIGQAFAVLLPCKSVGVMGDCRTYERVLALRAAATSDFMTAKAHRMPYEILETVSTRIINEVRGINRVVYDCTSKPPGTIEWE
ncbi:hypothetical protein FNF29_08193 [Cafeteria roenbergensis]|uniref:GMP synthase [glutamine-hydrolyzing] n=1 Tax=Cafeteria roenbergensis TaxID=33653 RepID=A0A5A8BZM9_CAFRO|nr:hypothetical protein FNF29_08193 [Cafeteria roenbergensis]|eukprot:KAA0146176.1 hypothetical protein FNF29_08193 [Cafeteria roenbergensis]